MASRTTKLDHSPRHPIGVVSRRTGLKQDLIRAWERRYGAVEPARSESRRRFYSDADVERLLLLRKAVDAGRNISQVAPLPNHELEALIADDAAAAVRAPAAPYRPTPTAWGDGRQAPDDLAGSILERCLSAVHRLDSRDLEVQLERASVALARIQLVERVLVPLMHRIGDLWQEGALRPVHEHVASAVVRSFVGAMGSAYRGNPGAPRLIATTPARQHHELGALIVSACAAAEGWDVTYLGSDLPAEEIAAAALQKSARAVALSITYPPDDPLLATELEKLGRLLPASVRLVVGGRSAGAYGEVLDAAGACRIDELPALRDELARLRSGSSRSS